MTQTTFKKPVPNRFAHKGKWSEAQVERVLKDRATRQGFAFHRFPDSRAARGAVGPQPSDYLVSSVMNVRPTMFLEVKETAEKYRLPLARITQYAKLKIFHLAGTPSAVVIYCSFHEHWRVLRAEVLFQDDGSKSIPFDVMAGPFDTAEHALAYAI